MLPHTLVQWSAKPTRPVYKLHSVATNRLMAPSPTRLLARESSSVVGPVVLDSWPQAITSAGTVEAESFLTHNTM